MTRKQVFLLSLFVGLISAISLVSNYPYNLTDAGTTIKQIRSNTSGHLYILLSDSSIRVYSPTLQLLQTYPNPISS